LVGVIWFEGASPEEECMKIRDVMTRDVELIGPESTIQHAATKMAEADVGLLPVGEGDRLVGMITDRDIAVRGVANGKNPTKTKVRDVMTEQVLYCFEDDDADRAAESMSELQVRRMPVVDRDKRLIGVVSLADLALKHDTGKAGEALGGVVMPASGGASAADELD
jgi:CBS domain-containing protein